MAVSEIHAARITVNRMIAYIMKDKDETVQSESEINQQYHHQILERGKNGICVRYYTQSNFHRCSSENPYQTFKELQQKFQKDKSSAKTRSKNNEEPLAYHARISFAGHECSQEVAMEIGDRVAESLFKGFPTVVAVHTNTDNIHIHFAVCAWNTDGRKWNNCHKTTQMLRDVTDQLCEEYGLSILEQTRKMHIVRTETGSYENTDHRYEHGSPAYVNTKKYEELKKKRMTQSDIVKQDIDMLLPRASSYENLLDLLRMLGYQIRAKKQDGDWMKHVSFLAPAFSKAVREDKIGDGSYYCRKNLEAVIAERIAKHPELAEENLDGIDDIPIYDDYRYTKVPVQSMREDYYKKRRTDGTVVQRRRTEWQNKAIRSLKKDDLHVRTLLDTTEIWKLAEEQEKLSARKLKQREDSEAARYVAQIENTFRALHYTEQNEFESYGQMLNVIKAIHRDYAEILVKKEEAEKLVSDRERNLRVPEQVAELKERIKNRDLSYMVEHYQDDVTKLDKLLARSKTLGFQDPEKFRQYKEKTEEYRAQLTQLTKMLQAAEERLDDADNCIRTYARIDSEYGIDVSAPMRRYEQILRGEYELPEPNRENSRNNVGRDER